ncbi:transcription initiation factor IIB [Nematocida ausubeli]|uniref:B-related factor 1 n=1 Tax=Nematocida ausubeli (strain ATCC PRA-371 / ERTm2) TaxID=1913371 RepID=H8ZFK1_NEMA1|nr:transcription initiation factor IIB [Nematocida ausubeli]
MKCAICINSKIETDAARDISYCTSCGLVIEESTIVSDVQFAQDTKGSSILQGQYVSTGDTKKLVSGKFITTNHTTTIRSIAKSIGEALGIGDSQINSAMRWYNLSLQFNFTKGRKTQVLLAACLYITCREEETPHMLVDFAYILRINVFKIGSIFLKLIRLLNITMPLVDPSLFVPRFCSKLSLNNQSIGKTALRLIARMDRDWIVIGRKPAGICGAAILIASRIHGNERTVEDVAGAVRVCEATINKRLAELKETATANLSINEFNTIWLEKEEDPPIVKLRGKVLNESFCRRLSASEDHKGTRDILDNQKNITDNHRNILDSYKNLQKTKTYENQNHRNITDNYQDTHKNIQDIQRNPLETNEIAAYNKHLQEVTSDYEKCTKFTESPDSDDYIGTPASLQTDPINITSYNFPTNYESDLSDCSIELENDLFLSQEEIKEKERIWNVMYGDFLLERKKKEGRDKKEKKKEKKKKRKEKEKIPLQDAVESAVKTKNLSSRINYAAIKNLFQQ